MCIGHIAPSVHASYFIFSVVVVLHAGYLGWDKGRQVCDVPSDDSIGNLSRRVKHAVRSES